MLNERADELSTLMQEGRLPISMQKVSSVPYDSTETLEEEIGLRSSQADLVIAGLTAEDLDSADFAQTLRSYAAANDVLFVHAVEQISID